MACDTNVLCGFDDTFAPHFATMISSLLTASESPKSVKIFLIANFLTSPVRDQLSQIVSHYGVGPIQWLDVDVGPFLDAPVTMHFTRATYARLAAFDSLPLTRVLYLDVDLLCLADVAALHDWNLEGQTIGGVLDPSHTFCASHHKTDMGIPADALCFNGGVLVVDVAQWKKERMTDACIHFLKQHHSAIWWVDQDVLNGVFSHRWLRLPSIWNVQTHFWKPDLRERMAAIMPEELDAIHSPKIVHFNDPSKPWHFGYRHPFRETYFQYLAQSGWPHHTAKIPLRSGETDMATTFSAESNHGLDISKMIALAVGHHDAGRLAEAESLYRQVLALDPNNVSAWHLIGRLAHLTAHPDVAIKYIQYAIDRRPDYAEAYCDQGAILEELGRFKEAEAAFRRAVEVKPSLADAHYNLGHVLQQQRRLQDAVDCYRRALELNPLFEKARLNLGIALEDLKHLH